MANFDEVAEILEGYSRTCTHILNQWAAAKDGYEQCAGEQMARDVSAMQTSMDYLSRYLKASKD